MAPAGDTALHRLAAVDSTAFDGLYEESFRRVWRLASGRCRDRRGAEALTARILERAFRQLDPSQETAGWMRGLFRLVQEELRAEDH
jgi:DNA-directed RNA polymerase specialized sigma24 family protein